MLKIGARKRTVILTVTGFLEGAGVAFALVGAGVVGFLVGLVVGFLVGLAVGFLEGAGVAFALVGAGVVGAEVLAFVLLRHDSASLQKPSPMTP
jgi:hypothetical protein